jgi:biopolymer transport protein ExbD
MAHIDDGGDGRRSSNVDINIVPFIDLMSVLVIFLLITAVWTQVSMIQLGTSIYGKKTSDEQVKPPPRAEVPFRLDIRTAGHNIVIGRQEVQVPKLNGKYDIEKLGKELSKIKEAYPDKTDAVITMVDSLEYVYLIEGMDALLRSGFPELSVATGGGNE